MKLNLVSLERSRLIKAISRYLTYFNIFGQGQTLEYAGVITKFLERIKQNKSPIIFGDGTQIRDFIYVEDVSRAFLCAIKKNFKSGLHEIINSIFKRGYLKEVQKYSPQVNLKDLKPYPAGIRAQAVLEDGTLVHDFLFAESKRSIHVCNAPSPAATSAIPIGKYITQKATKAYNNLT